MEHESTLRFVTNLDRSGIEAQLRQVMQKAADRNLPAVAALLATADGRSRQELDQLIVECVRLIRETPEHKALSDQLEMVQINLPNLG
ncbi:MAG: hypothetical protein Q7U97_13100 [Rhodocyclaceae bacterium]|nr:hypothetical protein [Rhodocyclaceae bacterium]